MKGLNTSIFVTKEDITEEALIKAMEQGLEVYLPENIERFAKSVSGLIIKGATDELSSDERDVLEKGKKDLSKLVKKQVVDKKGYRRTVYVKMGEKLSHDTHTYKKPEEKKEGNSLKEIVGKKFRPFTSEKEDYHVRVDKIEGGNIHYSHLDNGEKKVADAKDFLDSYIRLKDSSSKEGEKKEQKPLIASKSDDIKWEKSPDGGEYAKYKLGVITRGEGNISVKLGQTSYNASSLEDAIAKIDKYTDEKIKKESEKS